MNENFIINDHLQIKYLTDSLRIIGLTPAGGTNIMADTGGFPPVPTPYGDFHFRGGHRLWHAPESMPRTYIPDSAVTITELPNGVRLEAQTEPGTGIRKQIEIQLAPDKPSATLIHTLFNDGLWAVELAPWTITQLRPGGTAILPISSGGVDPAGLLPNRQFSLWPYARINDSRLRLGDEFILFKTDALPQRFKMGYFNSSGWMAYWLDGILFRKTFDVHTGLRYPDNNCNAELYCNAHFLELETLAPLAMLLPGMSVTHKETWDVSNGLDALPVDIRKTLEQNI